MAQRTQFHGDPIEENTLYVVLYERKAFGEAYVSQSTTLSSVVRPSTHKRLTRPTPFLQHWALLLTGPAQAGQIHQATDRSGQWVYEIKELEQVQPTASMICMVGVGNIPPEQRAKAEEAMKSVNVPPEGGTLPTGEPFNCRTWLKLAVSALQKAGVLRLPMHVGMSPPQVRPVNRHYHFPLSVVSVSGLRSTTNRGMQRMLRQSSESEPASWCGPPAPTEGNCLSWRLVSCRRGTVLLRSKWQVTRRRWPS